MALLAALLALAVGYWGVWQLSERQERDEICTQLREMINREISAGRAVELQPEIYHILAECDNPTTMN